MAIKSTEKEAKINLGEDEEKIVINDKANTEKVRLLEDHSCIVAGKKYAFRNGSETECPSDVAAILIKAGIAVKL